MLNSNVDILVLVRIWGLFLTVSSCAFTNIFFWISFHSIEKICRSQKVISFTWNLISSTIGSNYLHSSILVCLLAYVHFSFRFRQCRTVLFQDKQLCVLCFHFLSPILCIFSIFLRVVDNVEQQCWHFSFGSDLGSFTICIFLCVNKYLFPSGLQFHLEFD